MYSGRSPDLRIFLIAAPSHSVHRNSGICSVRHRLQWPDRSRFSRDSLFTCFCRNLNTYFQTTLILLLFMQGQIIQQQIKIPGLHVRRPGIKCKNRLNPHLLYHRRGCEAYPYRYWAGLLALGSSYSPHLPIVKTVAFVGFVPDYSGGSAGALHPTSLFNPKQEPGYGIIQLSLFFNT